MIPIDQKLTEECKEFLMSEEFARYAAEFPVAYAKACLKTDLINSIGEWPLDWRKLGAFCQRFWETLPDDPSIRHGAFFRLCDFAERYCFG